MHFDPVVAAVNFVLQIERQEIKMNVFADGSLDGPIAIHSVIVVLTPVTGVGVEIFYVIRRK